MGEKKQRGTHAHFPFPRPPFRDPHDPLHPATSLFVIERRGWSWLECAQKNYSSSNQSLRIAPPIHACDNHRPSSRMFGI